MLRTRFPRFPRDSPSDYEQPVKVLSNSCLKKSNTLLFVWYQFYLLRQLRQLSVWAWQALPSAAGTCKSSPVLQHHPLTNSSASRHPTHQYRFFFQPHKVLPIIFSREFSLADVTVNALRNLYNSEFAGVSLLLTQSSTSYFQPWIFTVQFNSECFKELLQLRVCWCESPVNHELWPSITLASNPNIYPQFIQSLGQTDPLFLTNWLNRSEFHMFASENCVNSGSEVVRQVSGFGGQGWAVGHCFPFLRKSCWVMDLKIRPAVCTTLLALMVCSQNAQSCLCTHPYPARLSHFTPGTNLTPIAIPAWHQQLSCPGKPHTSSRLTIQIKSSIQFCWGWIISCLFTIHSFLSFEETFPCAISAVAAW